MRWMLLVLLGAGAFAQSEKPSFEVASVKPSPRDPSQDRIDINLGRAQRGTVTLANTTLSECIRFAWGLAGEEQIAGPDWIRDRQFRYHITAKAATPDTPYDQLLLMTQRLIEERFALKMHREPRPIPHLELTSAGAGPMKRSANQEEGGSVFKNYAIGRLNYDHLPMRTLAVLLSRQLKMVVLDNTRLTGYFDIDLRWTPEGPAGAEPTEPSEFPSVYRAVQQQLGLKLERSKGPLDVWVIDQANKNPEGN